MLLRLLQLLSVFLIVWVTGPAAAETINVSSGFLAFGPGTIPIGGVSLGGDRGFAVGFRGDGISDHTSAANCYFPECPPGAPIRLNAFASPDFGGGATLDGVGYPLSQCPPFPCANVMLQFTGQTVAPPFGGSTTVTLTVPVDFSGSFFHDATGMSSSSEQLVGSAIARLTLTEDDFPDFPQFPGEKWRYEGIQYQLTPEPTTLLLWGMTAAGLGLTVRRKRRRTRDSQPSPHSVTTGSRSMGPAASPIAPP